MFTELNTDGTKVKPISIFTALIQSLQLRRLPRDGDDFLSLQVLMEQADRLRLGPVVVFPEVSRLGTSLKFKKERNSDSCHESRIPIRMAKVFWR